MTAANEQKLDPAIVAALYVDHHYELRNFLLGVLKDSQLANDVLQATFAKMVEQGHTTQQDSRKAWLFRVAYREAMAIRRRDAVGDKVVRRLAWTHEHAASPPEEPLIRLEAVETVQTALNELPFAQQQIVRMKIYEEKTFAQIAKELNIPLGTALGRMRSAVMKLRVKLIEHE